MAPVIGCRRLLADQYAQHHINSCRWMSAACEALGERGQRWNGWTLRAAGAAGSGMGDSTNPRSESVRRTHSSIFSAWAAKLCPTRRPGKWTVHFSAPSHCAPLESTNHPPPSTLISPVSTTAELAPSASAQNRLQSFKPNPK